MNSLLLLDLSLPLKNPVIIFSVVLFIILFAPILFNRIKVPHIIGLIISGYAIKRMKNIIKNMLLILPKSFFTKIIYPITGGVCGYGQLKVMTFMSQEKKSPILC